MDNFEGHIANNETSNQLSDFENRVSLDPKHQITDIASDTPSNITSETPGSRTTSSDLLTNLTETPGSSTTSSDLTTNLMESHDVTTDNCIGQFSDNEHLEEAISETTESQQNVKRSEVHCVEQNLNGDEYNMIRQQLQHSASVTTTDTDLSKWRNTTRSDYGMHSDLDIHMAGPIFSSAT